MKNVRTILFAGLVGLSFMLPATAGAASIPETNVNGIKVPGNYVINADSRVAFIPGGVGLVVVNKDIALPPGAYYVKETGNNSPKGK